MLVGFFIFLFSFAAVNDGKDIANLIHKEKESVQTKENKVRDYLSQIYLLQKKLRKIEIQSNKLSKERFVKRKKIKQITKKIKEVSDEIYSMQKILQARLRVASQIMDNSLKEIIVFSKSPDEIDRMLKGLESVMSNDIEMIKDVEGKKKLHAENQKSLLKELDLYKKNKKQMNLSAIELMALKREKEKVIEKLKKDRETHLQVLNKLREKGESLLLVNQDLSKSIAKEIFKKSFFEYKGLLNYPIQTAISEKYGVKKIKDLSLFSKGVWFDAEPNEEVYSVAKGRIVFKGKIDEITNALIIDHGDHYYSVYMSVAISNIKQGQEIAYGQKIGYVAPNMSKNKSGLYFELRHYSDPLNPEDWFLNKVKQLSKASGNGEQL